MPFTTRELSRKDGDPIALFYFRYGSNAASYYAYTDAEYDVVAPGSVAGVDVTYISAPIMRQSITSSGTLDKATIELRIPRDLAITEKFRVYPPSIVVSAVIRQSHVDLPSSDYPPVWVGRVVGFSFEGSEAVLALEPFSTSMRRTGLRRNYQYGCPHVLYDSNTCRADKQEATISVTIDGLGDNLLIMPANWWESLRSPPVAVTKFLSGTVEWTTPEGNFEVRTILQIASGKDLILEGPTTGLIGSPGSTVDVILGCDRRHGVLTEDGDCHRLHIDSVVSPPTSNIKNFGGQPWIPFKNPIGSASPYY